MSLRFQDFTPAVSAVMSDHRRSACTVPGNALYLSRQGMSHLFVQAIHTVHTATIQALSLSVIRLTVMVS